MTGRWRPFLAVAAAALLIGACGEGAPAVPTAADAPSVQALADVPISPEPVETAAEPAETRTSPPTGKPKPKTTKTSKPSKPQASKTAKPKPKPKPKKPTKPKATCDPNYSGACVPVASDVDCAGGSGNGPKYVSGPVTVVGSDIYGLDNDSDGVGCES